MMSHTYPTPGSHLKWGVGNRLLLALLLALLTLGGLPAESQAVTTLQDLSYGYDNEGNVTAITDALNGNQTFSYDDLDRLTNATGPYGSFTYAYNEIGNLTTNPQVGSYVYPTSGATSVRPHAVSTAGGNTYTYDNNGNLISGAGRTISYDFENRPTSITSGGTTTTFVYDGNGSRVKKTVGTTTTLYVSKLYECETNTGGTFCTKFILAGQDKRLAMKQVSSGVVDYYHPDHLGSTSVMTTSAGVQEQAVTYYPFGNVRSNSGSINVPYQYTGKELDASTGLMFYEARYYDATLARFISSDTLVGNPRDPQDLNRYSYVNNNPLKYTDPTGHLKLKISKFFKRLGDPATTAIGVLTVPFGGVGLAILTQSQSGRYTLAAGTLAITTTAAFLTGNPVAIGAAVGAWSGGGLGAYSAARRGGDLSYGLAFGTTIGAVAGGVGGGVHSLHLAGTGHGFLASLGNGALSGLAGGATSGGLHATLDGRHIGVGIGYGAMFGTAGGVLGGAVNFYAGSVTQVDEFAKTLKYAWLDSIQQLNQVDAAIHALNTVIAVSAQIAEGAGHTAAEMIHTNKEINEELAERRRERLEREERARMSEENHK